MNKYYPEVGTKLYLSQRTGSYYVDMVRTPYTVVGQKSVYLVLNVADLRKHGG